MEIYRHFNKAECIYCQTKNTLSLGFVGILKSAIARNSLSENSQNISETDWLCCNCKKIINDKLKTFKKEQKLSHRLPRQLMEKKLLSNLVKVKTQGYILRKQIIQEFRIALEDLPSEKDDMDFQFDSFLSYEIKNRPELGYLTGKSNIRSAIIYDKKNFSEKSILAIHDLEKNNENLQMKSSSLEQCAVTSENELQKMTDEQVKLFRNAEEPFDYRKIFEETGKNSELFDNYLLEKYLHRPLVSFLEKVLGMDKDRTSNSSQNKQRLKLQMVIAILCNIQNKESIMMQNILGLIAYACGLRDKGFSILNKFSVICSINHIRREASKWSNMRRCIDEIDKKAFWRITVDNLNFLKKVFKNISNHRASIRQNVESLNRSSNSSN